VVRRGVVLVNAETSGTGTLMGWRTSGLALAMALAAVGTVGLVDALHAGAAAQGHTTVGVERDGTYFLRSSNSGGAADGAFHYGRAGDTPLAGDWNGDGSTTVGVRRGSRFFLRNSNSGGAAHLDFAYGRSSDTPIVGDWNGDGTVTVGVRRGSRFYLRNSNSGGPAHLDFAYGRSSDVPIVGDFNGDGRDTVGVRRGSRFYLRNSNSGGPADIEFAYGRSSDTPVTGDWNGDGSTTVGVRRGSRFYLRNANSGGPAHLDFAYGRSSDTPLTGAWGRLTAPSDPGPPSVRLTTVATMSSPIGGAVGPDGRLYLAERRGTVRRLSPSGGVSSILVDIRSDVSTSGEGGLLDLEFSADGSELYLSYTNTSGNTVIDAFGVSGSTIDPGDRRRVFELEQPFSNHNGGQIKVGPDGMLYVGLGDGGGSGDPLGHGQNRSTLHGSLLRIDPQGATPYAIPSDNPFVGVTGARSEIFSYGLRNPWRFSFDRSTGELWIADVGQSTREEVNRVTLARGSGANFGWNRMEGTVPFAGTEPSNHTRPVFEYETRGPFGCSITGGYVYRGSAIPALRGHYVFTDYCNSTIRALPVRSGGGVGSPFSLGISGDTVVSFAQDAAGELYILDFDGRVRRIDPR
jgi:glucose/arabinose dehydrogenase